MAISPALHPRPLVDLVRAAHGADCAKRFEAYDFDQATLYLFSDVCRSVMEDIGPTPGACTLMNALLAERVRAAIDVPFAVVAGAVKINGAYIFGNNSPIRGDRVFSESTPDFDGHVWMIFGRYLVDVSLARTALSGRAHPLLESTIRKKFGPKTGLFAIPTEEARRAGLLYLSRYVLTDAQIGPLAQGAKRCFGLDDGTARTA
ncbi:hypothetical protein [Sphingomonas pituitosa]|uniref:hypothetical protein n=1 Tax=Sphingomonas pituitosa TaxID=99597 RepID=UPI000831ECC8|nr:hypothetical protein [Sphingomonas pituitosa]